MPNNAHLGFAGGFLDGIQQSLAANRQQAQAAEDRKQAHAAEAIKFFLDPNNPNPPKDIGDLSFILQTAMPEIFGDKAGKPKAGQPDHKQLITGLLNSALQGGGPSGTVPTSPGAQDEHFDEGGPPNPNPLIDLPPNAGSGPAAGPAEPPSPTPTLGGIPVLTAEQKAARATEAENTAMLARVNFVRERILPALKATDPTATLDDAMAIAGIDMRRSGQTAAKAGTPPQVGTLGDFILRKETTLGRKLNDTEVAQARAEWTMQSRGVVREALAQSMFGAKAFVDLTPDQAKTVMEAEQQYLKDSAASRTEGAGAGAMNVPANFATSRDNNVPVGTTPAQVSGQTVATAPEVDRRHSVEALRDQLKHIKTDLLGVLPMKDDLVGGLLPGAVLSLRRRSPETREAVASLESALNNIVNVAARSVGEQKGAQTENDAQRAEAAIVSLKEDLFSPTKGDTQESAKARIDETLKVLEGILSRLPGDLVPGAKPAAAAKPAAGAVPGVTMKDGKLYVNGTLMPGQ